MTRGSHLRENRQGFESGSTATEYAILVGFLAFVLVAGATAVAVGLNTQFGSMGTLIGGWPMP